MTNKSALPVFSASTARPNEVYRAPKGFLFAVEDKSSGGTWYGKNCRASIAKLVPESSFNSNKLYKKEDQTKMFGTTFYLQRK